MLIREKPDLSKAKLLKATKMLKLECKYLYLCLIVKVDLIMDPIASGSSTSQALNLSNKIKAKFEDVFKTKLPIGLLPPRRNVEHCIEFVPRANPVTRLPYRMRLKEKNEVKKVEDEYLSKGLICPHF